MNWKDPFGKKAREEAQRKAGQLANARACFSHRIRQDEKGYFRVEMLNPWGEWGRMPNIEGMTDDFGSFEFAVKIAKDREAELRRAVEALASARLENENTYYPPGYLKTSDNADRSHHDLWVQAVHDLWRRVRR